MVISPTLEGRLKCFFQFSVSESISLYESNRLAMRDRKNQESVVVKMLDLSSEDPASSPNTLQGSLVDFKPVILVNLLHMSVSGKKRSPCFPLQSPEKGAPSISSGGADRNNGGEAVLQVTFGAGIKS